jgi:hypothetical protein
MGADSRGRIDSSGFPLQIGLAHAINSGSREHGWTVLHSEHGWTNADTGEFGFIDLVVQNRAGTVVLNVECKRPQQATWHFLLPAPDDGPTGRTKLWASVGSDAGMTRFDWLDTEIWPVSNESAFCVVPGQDSSSRPMLERTAGLVVAATEALAQEEAGFLRQGPASQYRVYINVIATTATLEACKFEPAEVDLSTGKVGAVDGEEVPFIRFRKQLSTRRELSEHPDPWSLASARENTVFVVQASRFTEFLNQIRVDGPAWHKVMRNS